MNYLFLDIDGVLFHLGGIIYHRLNRQEEAEPKRELSLESKALLQRFLKDFPNTQIIISSTWRRSHTMEEIKEALGPHISDKIVGVTESLNLPRGQEIKKWMDDHVPNWNVRQVLILDDDCDMNPLMGCLFNTDAHNGLTPKDWIAMTDFMKMTQNKKNWFILKKFIWFNTRNAYYISRFKTKMFFYKIKRLLTSKA